VRLAIELFLATLCIRMKDGGFSLHQNANGQPYGPYNGYKETFGKDFETYGYGFGIPYGILTGIAALTLTFLVLQKIIVNSELSPLKTRAQTLFDQYQPLTQSNSGVGGATSTTARP